MNRRVFLIAALALAGCASLPPPKIQAPPGSALQELEPLYLALAGRDALTIQVSSNGCTAKEDFAFYVEPRGEAVTLAFGRKRIDTCKSFAMGRQELTFSWAELGLKPRTPVFLLNPLVPWTGPGA
ncbi:hypothetical protein [Phenylobacterium soli]|uniref:Lipoprotein n=1 Tax=Phenylobacterium soli TaxID=2170551 RepID=A0A328AJP3_9CAUL|nr:hypothetical protein [Phenylobacterium soli]RAK54727.1 hypothetical protein DJ017_09415 [Phenylobacterium soli]